MASFNSFNDLFIHELKDLYSAENQLIEALPKMQEKAHNSDLKHAFESHLQETRRHKERLEKIGNILDVKLPGETCEAMKGLIKENEEILKSDGNNDVKDAGLIAGAQRVEHYEMAGYGSAKNFAEKLGHGDVARILEETLKEEKEADSKLNFIAVEKVNEEAVH